MKSKTEKINQENKANYTFLLQCMGALAATAVVSLGMIAAMTIKTGAIVATGLAAKTMFAASVTAAIAFPAIIPIALLIVAVGAICLLPFLFGRSPVYSVGNPGYGYYERNYISPSPYIARYPTFYQPHDHHHSSSVYNAPSSGPVHQHGHSHNHAPTTHQHGYQ